NVEDFVPDEFVLKAQWLFAQDCVAAHHHRIFQTTALDQIFLHQRLDLFVVNKRPGRRDLALEEFRYDVGRHELREAVVWPGLGARNPGQTTASRNSCRPTSYRNSSSARSRRPGRLFTTKRSSR